MCKGPAHGSLQTWGCCLGAGGATPQPGPEQQGLGALPAHPLGAEAGRAGTRQDSWEEGFTRRCFCDLGAFWAGPGPLKHGGLEALVGTELPLPRGHGLCLRYLPAP